MPDIERLFDYRPEEELVHVYSYNLIWVSVSIFLAIFTSYVALRMIENIDKGNDERYKNILSLVSALTMGLGIWTMHFVGMLAIDMSHTPSFHPLTTLFSIVPGLLGAVISLCLLWRLDIGMTGMIFEGYIGYDPLLFSMSIIVAITFSYFALYLKEKMENALPIVTAFGSGPLYQPHTSPEWKQHTFSWEAQPYRVQI